VGSSLVEFTLVFPVLLVVLLGTVDVGFMLFEWMLANKAANVGAHRAIVSDPVAQDINNPAYDPTLAGKPCQNQNTGAATGFCPVVPSSLCTTNQNTGVLSCTNYTKNDTAFTTIFTPMQNIFPRLQPQNVTISYQRNNNLGFSGRPGGLPMEVTVSITGMAHQFFFVGPLVSFLGGFITSTPGIPPFATTLTSEDMCSDTTSCG
jgi:Flp pilus assembly protein TadG